MVTTTDTPIDATQRTRIAGIVIATLLTFASW